MKSNFEPSSIDTSSHIGHHGADDDSSIFAEGSYIKSLLEQNEQSRTVYDQLRTLYEQGEPAKEQFDKLVDDAVYQILSSNKEFMSNACEMRSTKNPEKQKAIKERQLELFKDCRSVLMAEAGLPDVAGLDQLERAKHDIAQKVETYMLSHNKAPDDVDVLSVLGIISKDDDGRDFFTYPQGLFPKSVDAKWNIYLDTIRNELSLRRSMAAGISAPIDHNEADKQRRFAHNSLAKDFQYVLSLGEDPESKWSFDDTRKLIEKMVNHKFPTVETAEKDRTELEIRSSMLVLQALRSRLNDMHKTP